LNTSEVKDWLKDGNLSISSSKYVLPENEIYFADTFAASYRPIVYSHECLSGDPEGSYYRIVGRKKGTDLCIQYYFYWTYQECMMSSHKYDYEPVFIFLKKNDSHPYLVVNGGLGGVLCGFHKNEIRPRDAERSSNNIHFSENISKQPYYPFGGEGNIKYEGCASIYPLDGDDLQFENQHPLFGIRACSNVLSGARYDLTGSRFDPPLKKLTDEVLTKWYFSHFANANEMPFGHDVADPFSFPYVKYRCAKEAIINLTHKENQNKQA
jgi:hypothetical protein